MLFGQTERYLLPGRGRNKKGNALDIGQDPRQGPVNMLISSHADIFARLLKSLDALEMSELLKHLPGALKIFCFYRLQPVGFYLLPKGNDFEGLTFSSHTVVLMASSGESCVTFVVFALNDRGEFDPFWGCTKSIPLTEHSDAFYDTFHGRLIEGLNHIAALADSLSANGDHTGR